MIDVHELRVGNRLLKDGIVVTIDARSIFDIWDKSEQYSPIVLTPDVLDSIEGIKYLKVDGIVSIDDDAQDGNTHNWTLKIKRNSVYDGMTDRFELVRWGDLQEDKIWFANQWLRVHVSTLHQLQNLFYFITGQELQFKS